MHPFPRCCFPAFLAFSLLVVGCDDNTYRTEEPDGAKKLYSTYGDWWSSDASGDKQLRFLDGGHFIQENITGSTASKSYEVFIGEWTSRNREVGDTLTIQRNRRETSSDGIHWTRDRSFIPTHEIVAVSRPSSGSLEFSWGKRRVGSFRGGRCKSFPIDHVVAPFFEPESGSYPGPILVTLLTPTIDTSYYLGAHNIRWKRGLIDASDSLTTNTGWGSVLWVPISRTLNSQAVATLGDLPDGAGRNLIRSPVRTAQYRITGPIPGIDPNSKIVGTWSTERHPDLITEHYEMVFRPNGQFSHSKRKWSGGLWYNESQDSGTWFLVGKDSVATVVESSASSWTGDDIYEVGPSMGFDTMWFQRSGDKLITRQGVTLGDGGSGILEQTWDPEAINRFNWFNW
ncbi:MAG: hypothetical protein IPN71_01720 [Fibrobacteres bacterium]|nr:hypothetical protein [Fibrobacterota bacterium]